MMEDMAKQLRGHQYRVGTQPISASLMKGIFNLCQYETFSIVCANSDFVALDTPEAPAKQGSALLLILHHLA